MYISKCIVEVVIPLSFVISECTLLILGEHKNQQFFLKKLYWGDTDFSACTVDGGGTAWVTAFDGAITVDGTIVVACRTGWCDFRWARSVASLYSVDRLRRQRR